MAEPRLDVIGVGEVMLRYSVPVGERLEEARALDVYPGGAEGNTAFALAQLGRRAGWVGALPRNPLGRLVARQLRAAGVDLDGVVWSEAGRVGTYYVEFAAPPRAIQVVYDRADSCAAQLTPDALDWDYLLSARIVHVSGITAAVSPSGLAVVRELLTRARAAGVAVSFDINYRARLWGEAEARAALRPLVAGVEILFCNQGDAKRIFDATGTPEAIVTRLAEMTGARQVVTTFGADGVVGWQAGAFASAAALPVQMVDRLGAGDALAAGVLHGWLDGDFRRGLRYGVVLAALALSQMGDMVVTTPQEVEALLLNAGGGIHR